MCGIAGIWGKADPERVRRMLAAMAHRGPDGEGLLELKRGTIGHRRLAIMDPERGRQPLRSEDGATALLANGEVYNYPRLRASLEARHEFATRSDSESILHLFEDVGPLAVRRLDGMFTFAVATDHRLFLARDALGIKPLYYALAEEGTAEETLYFASELKALADLDHDLDLDLAVREFPPGTCYDSDRGFLPFYTVPEQVPRNMPLRYSLELVRTTLEECVEKRLMSDVPLGCFLSGGLDSSLIAALVRQRVDELHTFSVGIEGSADLEAARRVSAHLGTIHHETIFTADEVRDVLPRVIYHLESFDEDLVRSAVPTYFCARLAAERVKVILTGEGADELFAGYDYYKQYDDNNLLHEELHRSVSALHNMNLQRVDRMTMAHGLEGRVPFLDVNMVEMAGTIPPELKMREEEGSGPVEKWILRKACEDLLPPELVWRDKQQFDEGSGMGEIMGEVLAELCEDFDADAHRAAFPADDLRSREEAYYHSLLVEHFGPSRAVLDNVARWRDEAARR